MQKAAVGTATWVMRGGMLISVVTDSVGLPTLKSSLMRRSVGLIIVMLIQHHGSGDLVYRQGLRQP